MTENRQCLVGRGKLLLIAMCLLIGLLLAAVGAVILVLFLQSENLVVSSVGFPALSVAADRKLFGLVNGFLDFFLQVFIHSDLVPVFLAVDIDLGTKF